MKSVNVRRFLERVINAMGEKISTYYHEPETDTYRVITSEYKNVVIYGGMTGTMYIRENSCEKNNRLIVVYQLENFETQKEFCEKVHKDLFDYLMNECEELKAEQEQSTEETSELEQPTEEPSELEQPAHIDTDSVTNTWEETNKRLSEKYGEDYCIGNLYPDVPKVNPHLVNAWHYRADVYKYRKYYCQPNRYVKPRWAQKPKPTKEKLTTYRAFKMMVKDAMLYKNTIDRLFTVHSYLMKLHQKGKITRTEYYFYTNKLENMYNECLR